jgi:hypothetical protein
VTLAVSVTDSQNHSAGPLTYSINVINGPNGANNKYLSGTYVCKFDGFNDGDSSRWTSLSSFQANGAAGTLTNGVWDMNSRDLPSEMSGTSTGTYSIGSDNNGLMTINSVQTSGGSGTHSGKYAVALNNAGSLTTATQFGLVEIDDLGSAPSAMHGIGNCYLATTSAFADATINGKSFAVGLQGENGSGTPKAYVGRFSASAGTITNGILDGMRADQSADNGGTFGGSYTTVNSSGRFTLTFTPTGSPNSMVLVGYVIDANRMFVLETAGDSGLLAGDMRTQQQGSYSGANLSGAFVFYTQGFEYSNNSVSGYDSSASQASGNGAGNVTINKDYQNSNGSYQVGKENGTMIGVTFDSANPGRVTFSPGTDSIYWYLFDTNSAFHLDMGSGYLETGWIEPQTQTTFTNAAIAGTYLFGQMPPMRASQHANIGEFTVNGSGGMAGGVTDAGQGLFSYDQNQSMTYSWDSTTYGTFLVGTVSNGGSCVVISATKAVCENNGDSSPAVLIFQQ